MTALSAAIALIGAVLLVPSAQGSPGQAIKQPGPLVVVGVPTLAWNQVSRVRTPALWSVIRRGAVGAMTTRALANHSCSPESWLTLSAGFAATNGHPPLRCPSPPAVSPAPKAGSGAPIAGWRGWHRRMLAASTPATIGMLGDVLDRHGMCISSFGADAALGAATSDGVASHVAPTLGRLDLRTCPVAFVSLKQYDDQALGHLLDRLPSDATVVVAGMADDRGPTTLHAVAVAGPGVSRGILTSESTRQRGLVETTDLTALVLARVGPGAPVLRIGRAPTVQPDSTMSAVGDVRDLTKALNIEHPFVPTFFGLFLGGSLALLLVGVLRWWWISRPSTVHPRVHHRRLRAWFTLVGALCACMPVATFLVGIVPWWRSQHPRAALCIGIAVASAILTAAALLGPWRRRRAGPMIFLVTITYVVIGLDVLRGSRLQLVSVMGLQPVYGGRYYGMGNVGAAIWLTASLLMSTMLADRLIRGGRRRAATWTVVAIGLVTLTIDSAPWWGAKAGAMLAIVPAFSFLAIRVARGRLTGRRIVAIVALTMVITAAFGLLDYLRPAQERTHIGTTVSDVIDHGDLHGMASIVLLNWRMLTSSWLNASVLVLIAVMVLVLIRPGFVARPLGDVLDAYPLVGPGLVAVVLCWLLAFLSEDSGTGIPPTGLLVLAPLLIMLAARLGDSAGGGRPKGAADAAQGRPGSPSRSARADRPADQR
ncbi:MAG: hypothetical protein FWE71_05590 [Nocardioidaceae bacterium]|nr:hypothetical protein [Nocardioidaceae bacterium]MCL2614506.1 hypothetical protein [Nocardioidaceae bacterium]